MTSARERQEQRLKKQKKKQKKKKQQQLESLLGLFDIQLELNTNHRTDAAMEAVVLLLLLRSGSLLVHIRNVSAGNSS